MEPIVRFQSHVSLGYRLKYNAIGAVLTGLACVLAFPMVTYMDSLPIWGMVLAWIAFTIAAVIPLPFWARASLKLNRSATFTDGKLIVQSDADISQVEPNTIRVFAVRSITSNWGGKLYQVYATLNDAGDVPILETTEASRAERVKRQLESLILPDRQPDHHGQ